MTGDKNGVFFFMSVKYESKLEESRSLAYKITAEKAGELCFWIFLMNLLLIR